MNPNPSEAVLKIILIRNMSSFRWIPSLRLKETPILIQCFLVYLLSPRGMLLHIHSAQELDPAPRRAVSYLLCPKLNDSESEYPDVWVWVETTRWNTLQKLLKFRRSWAEVTRHEGNFDSDHLHARIDAVHRHQGLVGETFRNFLVDFSPSLKSAILTAKIQYIRFSTIGFSNSVRKLCIVLIRFYCAERET